MLIHISYGGNGRLEDVVPGSNVGCIRQNRNLAISYGYSADDQPVVNGVPAQDNVVLTEGDRVTFMTRSHEKALA